MFININIEDKPAQQVGVAEHMLIEEGLGGLARPDGLSWE